MTECTITVTVPMHRTNFFKMKIARAKHQATPTHRHRTITIDQSFKPCTTCRTPKWIDDGYSVCFDCHRADQDDDDE